MGCRDGSQWLWKARASSQPLTRAVIEESRRHVNVSDHSRRQTEKTKKTLKRHARQQGKEQRPQTKSGFPIIVWSASSVHGRLCVCVKTLLGWMRKGKSGTVSHLQFGLHRADSKGTKNKESTRSQIRLGTFGYTFWYNSLDCIENELWIESWTWFKRRFGTFPVPRFVPSWIVPSQKKTTNRWIGAGKGRGSPPGSKISQLRKFRFQWKTEPSLGSG